MQKKLLLFCLVVLTNVHASEEEKKQRKQEKQSVLITWLLTLSIHEKIIKDLFKPQEPTPLTIPQHHQQPKQYKPMPKHDNKRRKKQINRRIQQYRKR